jgi:hypothetical protein
MCDGTTYTAVAVPGQGQWTPALVTTSNVVLIPFSFEFVVTNLTTGETETFPFSKPAADQAANVTCTFTLTETDPVTGETLRIVGTAEGLRAPPVG